MESQELESVEAFEEHLDSQGMGTPSYEGALCFDVFLSASISAKGSLIFK